MEKRRVKILDRGHWIERDVDVPDHHPFDTDYEGRVATYLNGIYGSNWKPLFETDAAKATQSAIALARRGLTGFGLSAPTDEKLFSALNTRTKRKHHNKYPRR